MKLIKVFLQYKKNVDILNLSSEKSQEEGESNTIIIFKAKLVYQKLVFHSFLNTFFFLHLKKCCIEDALRHH